MFNGFSKGGPITWVESKYDSILGITLFPQATYQTQQAHTHDHVGGGGISFNAWHSAMLLALQGEDDVFFRFTSIPDLDDVPIEIPAGTPINSALIQDQPTYDANVPAHTRNVSRYHSVWEFIYSPEILEQRWAALNI